MERQTFDVFVGVPRSTMRCEFGVFPQNVELAHAVLQGPESSALSPSSLLVVCNHANPPSERTTHIHAVFLFPGARAVHPAGTPVNLIITYPCSCNFGLHGAVGSPGALGQKLLVCTFSTRSPFDEELSTPSFGHYVFYGFVAYRRS